MSSQPLCRRHHTNYVGHHRWHMYAIICTIHDIISSLYDNNPQYSWHHMHYIWHIIYCVWYHIHYMCDIRHWLYLWHHTLYGYDISTLYGITHSVIRTQPLCKLTAMMSDITPTVSVSSHPLYQLYQTQCMDDITATICMTSYALHMTSHRLFRTSHHFIYVSIPLYLTSRPVYMGHHTQSIGDITDTIYMTSHPVYLWYHIHYIYDIISSKCYITKLFVDDTTLGICMTSFALQMASHPLFHIKPQNLWGHILFRHDITALYQTSHPLYLYHHKLSTDITPTIVWHHTYLLCEIIFTKYILTSNPHFITLLYWWHHNLYIWNHIQYEGNIYT